MYGRASKAIICFAFALALCIPAFWLGRSATFFDTLSYYQKGAMAAEFLQDLFVAEESKPFRDGGLQTYISEKYTPRSVRSITYSVFSFVLSFPSTTFLSLVFFQALGVAWCCVTLLDKIVNLERTNSPIGGSVGEPIRVLSWQIWAYIGLVTCLTTAPWFVSWAMPDIFAGVGLLALCLILFFFKQLVLTEKLITSALLLVSLLVHHSHLLLMPVVWLSGAVCLWFSARGTLGSHRLQWHIYHGAIFGLIVFCAAFISLALMGFFAFGQFDPVAKRLPLPLAKSLEDGPARWHLIGECDTYKYTICDVYEVLPTTIEDFMWRQETSVLKRTTPEQLEAILDEEATILARAAAQYPGRTGLSWLWNTAKQLVLFDLYDLSFKKRIVTREASAPRFERDENPSPPKWLANQIQRVAVGLSIMFLAFYYWPRRSGSAQTHGPLVLTLVSAIVLNAAICANLSAPSGRYQGRVIWILPLLAIILFLYKCNKGPVALLRRGTTPTNPT